MDHSYEEIRNAALDILADREKTIYPPDQYNSLETGIAEVFARREAKPDQEVSRHDRPRLSAADSELFLEVFWNLFREGIITLGYNSANKEFPFFRVSRFGRRIIENQDTYFFHDVSTYTTLLKDNIANDGRRAKRLAGEKRGARSSRVLWRVPFAGLGSGRVNPRTCVRREIRGLGCLIHLTGQ